MARNCEHQFEECGFNGGAWASIQITLNEARRIQEVRMSIPGYSILLSQRDLNNFSQQYQFDGKKLRLKSRDSYRLDLKSAGVASFTFDRDVDLTTPVFAKRLREE